MKRRQLFELEDQPWFPSALRVALTRYVAAFHRVLGTADEVAELAARALEESGARHIHDFGSGQGGPQADVLAALRRRPGLEEVTVTLSDLYPSPQAAAACREIPGLSYRAEPLDAARPGPLGPGLRTLICSLHHLRPAAARAALGDAVRARQPLLAYELSDNSAPALLWWTAIPAAALLSLLVTLRVRPASWLQLALTYLIPVLPLCIGWDGAVSNLRTYGLSDLDELLVELPAAGYRWEKGTLGAGPSRRLYLLGLPTPSPSAAE